ncbi:DNA polymerase [Bacillus phage Harambe]|uniref:DNA polymerase n=1 Tax=Bacillus phage Harambe TaxID=1981931 RepID=A0A1W6JSC0_9CAUD|nr:DNA polymerase [Bacillus phage Harambe]ARM70154.1 DNA polymerase [Bacillus phage Harambe]
MGNKKRKIYSCDFETTTDVNDCRVWAYGLMEIDGKFENYKEGNNIDEFMEWTEQEQGDLYFHNLRFDGEFIVNWLLHKGYRFNNTRKAGTFNAVISSMGQWYKIDIYYGREGKKVFKTSIYDSLKKLPFPVKTIAKAFKLPIEKGDIDYDAPRPVGHQITPDESKYIKNDVEIIARALHSQLNTAKLTKMTIGSDALDGFKHSLHKSPKVSKRMYDHHFPVISNAIHEEFKKAYRGGFTWANPKYAGKVIGNGLVFDVNSLYPSVMYDKPLPYGLPVPFSGEYEYDETHPLFIQHIKCGFELKDGHIPTIQIKKNFRFADNEYLHSSEGNILDLHVTNVDLALIKEHYTLYEEEYLQGYKFKQVTGLFKNYIDYWSDKKINAEDPAIRQMAKLMLNSLYGKFGTSIDVTGKEVFLKEDGSTGFRKGQKEERDPVYMPMGAFITAYARDVTIRTAQKCYDRILYCDTDSIHLVGTEIPEAIKDRIHDKKLGYWAHESTFWRAKFIRQKTYIEDLCMRFEGEKVNGEWKFKMVEEKDITKATARELSVKCAGMPAQVKQYVTFDNFGVDFKHDPNDYTDEEIKRKNIKFKLKPTHRKGGQVLVPTPFTIK